MSAGKFGRFCKRAVERLAVYVDGGRAAISVRVALVLLVRDGANPFGDLLVGQSTPDHVHDPVAARSRNAAVLFKRRAPVVSFHHDPSPAFGLMPSFSAMFFGIGSSQSNEYSNLGASNPTFTRVFDAKPALISHSFQLG